MKETTDDSTTHNRSSLYPLYSADFNPFITQASFIRFDLYD